MGCQKWPIYHYFKWDEICVPKPGRRSALYTKIKTHNVVISPATGMKFHRKMHHQVENMLVPFSEVNFILKFKQIKN